MKRDPRIPEADDGRARRDGRWSVLAVTLSSGPLPMSSAGQGAEGVCVTGAFSSRGMAS